MWVTDRGGERGRLDCARKGFLHGVTKCDQLVSPLGGGSIEGGGFFFSWM